MNTRTAKSQIKKLAEDFGLRYNPEWFRYIWISVRHEILTEYVGNCPDPVYQKYGKTAEQRIKNIDAFVSSKDFKDCLRRYGGQVVQRKDLPKEIKLIRKIEDESLRDELLRFYKNLERRFSKNDFLALLTIPRNKKERVWQVKSCLRHEWIHILLDKNKIKFQEISEKYWPYDEGLNEYLGSYLDGSLSKLEKFRDNENYPMEKKYWVYALKFRKLFEGAIGAREMKKVILDLISDLRKKG
tara:strand:+ start:427 stop:1152 length:726 start_codon:yes stop_codon:yes gene_type:complete